MKTTFLLFLLSGSTMFARSGPSVFRWISSTSDAAVCGEVKKAFAAELKPDQNDPLSQTVPMRVKFLQRVGLIDRSALVVVGEKEDKTDPYTVSRAYALDLKTATRIPLREKGVEWFWQWAPIKVAHLRSPDDTTVIFQFLTCTECEAETVLAGFHYSLKSNKWEIQQWGQDGPGLLIGSDTQYGDDGFYHFDCLHVVKDLTGDRLDDVAVRCRTRLQPDPEKNEMKTIRDEVLLYTAKNGSVVRQGVVAGSELAATIHRALCATAKGSALCSSSRAKAKLQH